jgi:hypothetical protein
MMPFRQSLGAALLLSGLAAIAGQAQTPAPDAAPPHTRRTSLLFDTAEAESMQKALSEVGKPRAPVAPDPADQADTAPAIPNVYLSAVAQFGPGQWTVWVNGYRIVPGRQAPGFQVLSVRDDQVEIAVTGDPPARFVLRPNQTWLAQSDAIVEGIVP